MMCLYALIIYYITKILCGFLQASVESLSEKSSGQGMVIHPCELLIKKTWVT